MEHGAEHTVQLLVGPDRVDRMPAAEQAWGRVGSVAPTTLGLPVPQFKLFTRHRVDQAIAISIPKLSASPNSEHVWIVLGGRFFELFEREQVLTLLHEMAHTKLYIGELRNRTLELQARGDAEMDRCPPDHPTLFFINRWSIARYFLTIADEMLAEELVQREVPHVAQERISMYRRMREETAKLDPFGRMEAPLQGWGMLYEIVRNDIGAWISPPGADRDWFSEQAERIASRLQSRPDGKVLLERRSSLLPAVNRRDFSPLDRCAREILDTRE